MNALVRILSRTAAALALPVGLPIVLWAVVYLIFAEDPVHPAPSAAVAAPVVTVAAPIVAVAATPALPAAAATDEQEPADELGHDPKVDVDDPEPAPAPKPVPAPVVKAPAPELADELGDEGAPESATPPAPEQALALPPTASTAAPSPQALAAILEDARAAAREGRSADAVVHYQAFIRHAPRSYDAYGEMGNAYLRLGMTPQAGWAYTTAALLLVDAGRPDLAEAMLPDLLRLDPAGAALLNQRLWSMRRP